MNIKPTTEPTASEVVAAIRWNIANGHYLTCPSCKATYSATCKWCPMCKPYTRNDADELST